MKFSSHSIEIFPFRIRWTIGLFRILLLSILIGFPVFSYSQVLVNGDLEQQWSATSSAPPEWQMVLYTDPNCQADFYGGDTPDIYTVNGPDPLFGMCGTPYSGNTFVAGGYGYHPTYDAFSQEGIMQTVSGFEIDSIYIIGFYQTVRVRNYCYDPSGSWMFIVDDQVIGISEPTYTTVGENSIYLEWENRELIFKASSTNHTLKFLPIDNDTSSIGNALGELGSPMMGIDSIYLKNYNCDRNFELGPDIILCEGDSIKLDAYQVNASFLWNTGETSSSIVVDTSGVYTVSVTVYDCPVVDSITYFDTVTVSFIPYPVFDLGDEVQYLCSNETIVLDVTMDNVTYLWQDGSIESTYMVSDTGTYFVHLDRLGCVWSDTVRFDLELCESILVMPNVFTPNGDGNNDVFQPVKSDGIVAMHTIILNRWGNVVFQTTDIHINWTGKDTLGLELADGVYFWVVEYEDEMGGLYTRRGIVHVLR